MAGKRRAIAASAAILMGLAALPAQSAPLAALNAHDVALYAAAFDAAEHGDTQAADQDIAQVNDPCLAGNVQYLEITHARAHSASYDELNRWLKAFGDLPGASQLYGLALKLRPADASPPAPASTVAAAADSGLHFRAAPQSHAAREAYFDGDVRHALGIARAAGDAWIAGLAAYRLGDYSNAMVSFETLAANPSEEDAVRSAGGVWAARAAVAAGLPDRATALLKIAAAEPETFYGMIAKRKLELADDPVGRLLDAAANSTAASPLAGPAPAQNETDLDRLARTDPRAHRAIALSQLARQIDAGAELRAGFAEAADDQTRALWMNLMFELSPNRPSTGEVVLHSASPVAMAHTEYPTPTLAPAGGFTIDKALVYAVVWQESRFNSLAVSPVGAVGLMQLMPPSAASMANDTTLLANPISLFDTGKNLALGQTYIKWLEDNAGNHDLLRTIAAYNGGPGTLARTEALLGPDADSLMVMESFPFAESRAYVKRVVAAYWSYRRQFGAPAKTLDAAASDQQRIDARLDEAPPPSAPVQDAQAPTATPRQPLEILLHHSG
ncbi:MAG TPA: lytic transglycosylase domain-containing protein [Caulobacteraceae bacterium]|jgi:soluble lytic murein transglycosylase-like protein